MAEPREAARARLRRRIRRRRARRAVTDVPLELVIIIIILAIVLPIIIAAFAAYSRDQELVTLSDQANRVANTAVEVYDDGINTSLVIQITVPSANGVNFTIGAPLYPNGVTGGVLPNPQSNYISYAISGTSPYLVEANNGGTTIPLTAMSCGTGNVLGYEWLTFAGNSAPWTLTLTKLGPGAYYCNQPISSTFVEVTALS